MGGLLPHIVINGAADFLLAKLAECMPLNADMAPAAGIIGGLLSYIVINGANLLLDKLAECMHWSIAGTDAQPSGAGGSFISRLQSNTGGAAQARPHSRPLTACLA